MADSFRRGGFGSPGFGPFQTNQGGFGQYAIGGTGEDTAYLDKLEAQIAWQNGRLDDDAYMRALERYVKQTEKGTSTYVRAVAELEDTRYSIDRNEAISTVNGAASPEARINALHRLIGIDRARLGQMRPGNEAFREQQQRIDDLDEQVRSTRWSIVTRDYSRGRLSDEAMVASANRYAREARGHADEQTYLDIAYDYQGRALRSDLAAATDTWDQKRTSGNARAVDAIYAQLLGRTNAQSAEGEELARSRQDFADSVKANAEAMEYEQMSNRHQRGVISDDDWLTYLQRRVGQQERGTIEYERARDTWLAESFNITQSTLSYAVSKGQRSPQVLIDFYQSSLATMDLDSSQARAIQAEVARLRATGLESLTIGARGGGGLAAYEGYLVGPSWRPAGMGGGYVSQFDGSEFASTNCGMASAAMLAWAATDGKVKVTGGQMRYYSGDSEGGTWVDDVARALGVLDIGARVYTGMDFAAFRQKIKNGQPAVLTGTSGMLPASLAQGYAGPHSVYVDRLKVRPNGSVWYYVMDPLGRAGYKGEWWPEEAIYAFSWQGTAQGTQGSAVFAGRRGNARNVSGVLPPFQAFDTDWLGRSTLGQGGGTSREEAGQRRDWSQGRPSRPRQQREGRGEVGGGEPITDFLSAVRRISDRVREREGQSTQAPPENTEEARKLAGEVLERNGGDPRLAAIEWFSGETPAADVASWEQGDRWVANAVGRAMGLEKVERGDVLQAGAPADPVPAETADGAPGYDPLGSPQAEKEGPLLGVDPTLEKMAKGIIRRLGLTANADRTRIVAAWITSQNGGQAVQGYNPLMLRTNGVSDLDGQLGKMEDGRANFESLAAGMEAAADVIRTDAPELVGALRAGQPEAFAAALSDSDMSQGEDYAGQLVRTYNEMVGGTRPTIANLGPRPFATPVSLDAAARITPDLAELMDVDPRDANQVAWFKDNMDRAYEAALEGRSSWDYETPDGRTIRVSAHSRVVKDILAVDAAYESAVQPRTAEGFRAISEAEERYVSLATNIDFNRADRFMESAYETRDLAMARGDWTTAWNTEMTMRRYVNAVGGIGPNDTIDTSMLANTGLTDSQVDKMTRWVESLEPLSTDPFDPEHKADEGSVLAGMQRDGYLDVQYRTARGATASGLATEARLTGDAFVSMRPDGSVQVHTPDNDRASFTPTTELDANTNEPITIYLYQSRERGGRVHIQAGGLDIWQPLEQLPDARIVVGQAVYEGPDKQLALRQEQAIAPHDRLLNSAISGVGTIAGTSVAGGPLGGIAGMGIAAGAFWGEVAGIAGDIINGGSGAPATPPDPRKSITQSMGILDPAQVPLYQVMFRDPTTNEDVTLLTIDRTEWMGWVGRQQPGSKPPMLLINPGSGASAVATGDGRAEIKVGGQSYAGAQPIETILHWYGTQKGDVAAGDPASSMGAPGADYIHRRIGFAVGADRRVEGEVLDVSLSDRDLLRAGVITPRDFIARTMPQVASSASQAIALAVTLPAQAVREARRSVIDLANRIVWERAGLPQLAIAPGYHGGDSTLLRIGAATTSAASTAAAERAAATVSLAREEEAARAEYEARIATQAERQAQLRQATPTVRPSPAPTAPAPAPSPTAPKVRPTPAPTATPTISPSPSPSPGPSPSPAPTTGTAPRATVPLRGEGTPYR